MNNTETDLLNFLSNVSLESWVIQVFLIVFLTLLLNFVLKRVFARLQVTLETTRTVWDHSVFEAMRAPLRAVVWVVGIVFAAELIHERTGAVIFATVDLIRDTAVIGIFAWFLMRFIRKVEENIIADKEAKGAEYDRTTYDAITKLLRVSVFITATLVVLQTLGFSVTGVFAFGGISGIAVGFAAKDLLGNFFGGLVIFLDRPFAVGDWVRSPDREIEGIVQRIGWRVTEIRCFDSRPRYVPNSVFTQITLENCSRMENREIWETVGVRHTDASKVVGIVQDVKAMLQNHSGIDTSKFLMVAFNKFAPSSLDFFIYCLTKTSKWIEFHEVKQDVLTRILEIIDSHGAEIARPTSMLHAPDGFSIAQHVKKAGEPRIVPKAVQSE